MPLRLVVKPHWKAHIAKATTTAHPTDPHTHRVTDHTWCSDINWVIMDYLVSEGYPGAAEKFAQETNMGAAADTESIRERVAVRNAIHAGDINAATELVNEIDPEVSHVLSFFNPVDMIIHRSFMHHSYSPLGDDDANSHFSPQYDPKHQHYNTSSSLTHPRTSN